MAIPGRHVRRVGESATALGSHLRGMLTVRVGQDLVRGLGPSEGSALLVPSVEEALDAGRGYPCC